MSADPSLLSLARLGRWQRRALAVAAGAASVLAMAPFFLWPVLFLTLPLLVLLIDDAVALAPRRVPAHAATIAWFFGFGYFLAGLFWIGEAFLVEAEKFAVLMPFAVLAMPAGLALFWAAAAALAALIWQPGLQRVVTLALTLALAEWLRGHILTGFPWNVLGYALTAPDVLMQSASLFGIYGLTLIAVILFAMPLVAWFDAYNAHQGQRASAHRAIVLPALASLLAFGTLAAWGTFRLAPPRPPDQAVRVRLVQPSIPQREKWKGDLQRRNFERHLDLTRRDSAGLIDDAKAIDLVVWPEAAMPFLALDIPAALEAIGRVVPAGGHLVAGLLRIEAPPVGTARRRRILNSLVAFGADGQPLAIYDKTHLVPFGEYLPLQETLEAIGLEQLTRIRGGFDVGPSPRPLLRIPGLPALAPLICYEAIFPGSVIQSSERPAALLNVTNDGWFGNTTGPRQHFHQARVRAVEEGIPIIRSANNGISAVVDSFGGVTARLDLDVAGVVDANLPGTLPAPPYARFGDATFWLLWLITAAGVMLSRLRARSKQYSQ
ncbi:MAG: apolipoprotein N-acyltransferase [Hyphomicrobiaceae bacterium]